ncbi:MAG: class I SAM-dependent methyltransferase [Thermodesulfobacteriota bacterium]|nr:class I SAM-dependent methyltransferase [Thermodesulfobacteriota bacterium]
MVQRLTRSPHIHGDIADLFHRFLATGSILDIPSGDGVNSRRLNKTGFTVRAADLFPDQCRDAGFVCDRVDMTKPLPYDDCCFDGILNSEGIEHIDNQIFVLQEFYRILKHGGILIVTTPNLLNLEGRLGMLLTGHAHRRRAMVISSAAYRSERPTNPSTAEGVYFGHVFLINLFQLRLYLTHVGFEVLGVDTTRYSWRSLILAPLLFFPVSWSTRKIVRGERSRVPYALQRDILSEVLSSPVLFGRKLIMFARKPPAHAATI